MKLRHAFLVTAAFLVGTTAFAGENKTHHNHGAKPAANDSLGSTAMPDGYDMNARNMEREDRIAAERRVEAERIAAERREELAREEAERRLASDEPADESYMYKRYSDHTQDMRTDPDRFNRIYQIKKHAMHRNLGTTTERSTRSTVLDNSAK